ncbi:unnamed protein product [Prunus armeniaca]
MPLSLSLFHSPSSSSSSFFSHFRSQLSSNDDYVPLASGLIRYEMGKEETRGRRSKEVDLVLMGGNLKMQSHHFVAVRLNDQTGTILGFVVYLALMTTIGFLEVSCGC